MFNVCNLIINIVFNYRLTKKYENYIFKSSFFDNSKNFKIVHINKYVVGNIFKTLTLFVLIYIVNYFKQIFYFYFLVKLLYISHYFYF